MINAIRIGDKTFPSKAAAIRCCQSILHRDKLDSNIVGEDAVLVMALLKMRPDKMDEIGERGVVRFLRKAHRHSTTPCFFVELDDGAFLDVSFMKIINAYPGNAKPRQPAGHPADA